MSFADPSTFGTKLKRTFEEDELATVQAHLDDATAYLQAEIGQLVEAGTSTFTETVECPRTRIDLPQQPVRQVTEVKINNEPVEDYRLIKGGIVRDSGWHGDVEITFDHGMTTIPGELAMYCCVLASGSLSQVERNGALTSGSVTSERIDDYSVQYTQNENSFSLPDRNLEQLRSRYGQGAYVVDSR